MSDITAQDALVMLMVMVSASDRSMKDEELAKIGEIVSSFPVFAGYSHERLVATSETASLALSEEGGLQSVLDSIAQAIPEKLRDTAYACGVEVAAADLALRQEELRMLQMLRDALDLDKLTVAALERIACLAAADVVCGAFDARYYRDSGDPGWQVWDPARRAWMWNGSSDELLPTTPIPIEAYEGPLWLAAGLKDQTWGRQAIAIAFGFTVALLVASDSVAGSQTGTAQWWWVVAAFAVPLLYAINSLYIASYWPDGIDALQAAQAQSLFMSAAMIVGSLATGLISDWSLVQRHLPAVLGIGLFETLAILVYLEVHHADVDLDVTSALRFHPLEIIVSMIWKGALVALLGAPAVAVLVFEIILNGMAMFNHSNVKLPLWLDRILLIFIVGSAQTDETTGISVVGQREGQAITKVLGDGQTGCKHEIVRVLINGREHLIEPAGLNCAGQVEGRADGSDQTDMDTGKPPRPIDESERRKIVSNNEPKDGAWHRFSMGVTQQELGEALGVTFQQVQKYLRGTNRISAGKLYEAAKFLNVEIGFFFAGLDDETDSAADDAYDVLLRDAAKLPDLDVREALMNMVGLLRPKTTTTSAPPSGP
eukprot:g16997.t1